MSQLLDTARAKVADALSIASRPIVACSFGRDSLLLLALCRETRDVPVVWFRSALLPSQRLFAERVIDEWNLTVIGWAPVNRYVVPNNIGLSLISEHMVGGRALPVITDLVHGKRCVLDMPTVRTPEVSFPYDAMLVGTRKTDSHYLTGPDMLPDSLPWGSTTIVAPLRDLTDGDVSALTDELQIPLNERRYIDGDDLANPDVSIYCTNCLQGDGSVFCEKEGASINSFEWDRQAALSSFRKRFGFAVEAA